MKEGGGGSGRKSGWEPRFLQTQDKIVLNSSMEKHGSTKAKGEKIAKEGVTKTSTNKKKERDNFTQRCGGGP